MSRTIQRRIERLQQLIPLVSAAPADAPPLWTPFPGPQTMAYTSTAHEILFGGAAGAGKTGLGVGLALTKHHRSLILRRQAVQAVEISDQLKHFSRGRARWSGRGHGGALTTDDGRVIEVGGCEHEDEWEKYSGRPHDLIVFDETTHFLHKQFRFISAWNRHEDPRQHCQVLLPTNPPTTPEGRWVITEFAPWIDPDYPNPARPGEIRWYTIIEDKVRWVDGPEPFTHNGETIKPRSRTFIPGRLADNPVLAGGDYGSRLQALPEPLRSQLLYGDFSLREEDHEQQVIPTAWARLAQRRWTSLRPLDVAQTCLGVDVARGGADATVICRRYGSWFDRLRLYPGKDTPDGKSVATLVLKAHEDTAAVHVDIIGVGGSVYDVLREQSWLTVRPINAAEARIIKHRRDRSGRLKFINVRAWGWWSLREALDPLHGDNLALPPDNELLAELTATHYTVGVSGVKVESKDEIRARLGRSTDRADAVWMAYFSPLKKMETPLRIVPIHNSPLRKADRERAKRTILVCGKDDFDIEVDAENTLIVNIHSTPGDESNLDQLHEQPLGREHVTIRPINPADYRARWGEALPEFGGLTAEQAALQMDEAKRFIRAVTCERAHKWTTLWLIADDADTAMSAACAVADVLSLPRQQFIWWPGRDDLPLGELETHKPEPPNRYIYDTIRATRAAMF